MDRTIDFWRISFQNPLVRLPRLLTRRTVHGTGLLLCTLSLVAGSRSASALDPSRALTQYGHETWTSRQGLPQDTIQAIAQTDDGYLWLATPAGLVRFDGMRFEVIDEGVVGPNQGNIWSMIRGREGGLWLGTEGGGLLRYRNGTFELFDRSKGLSNDFVRTLVEARDGSLWIATNGGGINRLKDGRFSVLGTRDGLPSDRVWALCEDRKGRLWIGTNGGGLAVLEEGRVRAFPKTGAFSDGFVWAIHEDRSGQIWIGTSGGLVRLSEGKATLYTKRDGLAGNTVRTLLSDREGSLWVGTTEGISRLRKGFIETLPREAGLASAFVRSLFEDRDGNLWVGSYGGGLDLLWNSLFTVHGELEGLSSSVTRPIIQARDGSIWIGTNNGGVNRLKGGKFRAWTTAQGLSSNVIWSICEDSSGRIWVGTNGWGIDIIEPSGRVRHSDEALPSLFVRALHCARDGSIWVGTTEGLVRLEGAQRQVFLVKDGLPANWVRTLHEGPTGRLWIGTMEGLGLFEGGRFRTFGTRQGLPGEAVDSILEEEDGVVWVGTSGGLARMNHGKVARVPLRPVMPDDFIYSIQDDDRGYLWLSSARGIFRFRRALLTSVADGASTPVTGSTYDAFDGMRTSECTGGFSPASFKDSRGQLWFPTARGAVVVDPVEAAAVEQAPTVTLEAVAIDDRMLRPGSPSVVPPKPQRLAFHFAALSLVNPRSVRFRYRLEGFEADWVEMSRGRVAVYTRLPPGDYTFRVAARRREGPWSEPPASVSFRVQAAFTQTWWFTALLVCAMGLVVWGGVSLRVRDLRARERLAERRVAERTVELRGEIEQRLRIEEGLRESEERFRTFVEQSAEGIVLVDEAGRTIEWNRAMEEITGFPRGAILGRPIEEVQREALNSPGSRGEVDPHSEPVPLLEAGALPMPDLDVDFELQRAGGRRVFLRQTTFRIPTARGFRTGAIVHDITARRHAELEREGLIRELEARNAELERFTYTVSHDLRSPLVTVRGFLGYLEQHAVAGNLDRLRSDVDRIIKATGRMDDLLRDLLELSRIGRIVNPPADCSFGAVVAEAMEMVQGPMAERGVEVRLAENLPVVRGDRLRLVEVVQNLLQNAIKFMGTGSKPAIQVGHRGLDAGGMAILFVRDNGIGIDPRHLHRIFGLFDKLDAQAEGTGIGLAVVKRVIEVHGGRVWAESDGPSQGATFCFTLPLAGSAEPERT